MMWMLLALAGAFCWALVHHLDKLLLTRFSASYGVGSIVIISCLFPLAVLPFLLLFIDTSLFVPTTIIIALVAAGLLGAIAALFYFYALENEEATIVVSMYQLSPVFGYVLGLAFLGEKLATTQIIGALITILGVTILSFEFLEEKRVRIRGKTTMLMASAAFLFALGDVVYKGAASSEIPYAAAMFWVFVGYIIFGFGALVGVRKYRENLRAVVARKSATILALNGLNEIFQTAALMCTAYALLLAPVALVLTIDAYQPILVFAIGIFLTIFAPSLAREKISLRHVLHKSAAIAIAVLGTILMQHV